MSGYKTLQQTCLILLTTPITPDAEHTYLNLFDRSLVNNSKVSKLLSNICNVATGRSDSLTGLEDCFDFITGKPVESLLELPLPLNPKQADILNTISNLISDSTQTEIKPLSKLEVNLCAVLSYIATNNLQELPPETFTLLQTALLNKDHQLTLLTKCDDILTDTNDQNLNNFIREVKSTVTEYNAIFLAIHNKFAAINSEAEKEDADLQLIYNLFEEIHQVIFEAQTIGCPKTDEILTTVQEIQYDYAEQSYNKLQLAIRDLFDEHVEDLINLATAFAGQAKSFQNPRAENLEVRIQELTIRRKNERAHEYVKLAEKNFESAHRKSTYNGNSFRLAATFASLAKKEGSDGAQELINVLHNTRLQKEIKEISKAINNWLPYYKQDLDEKIINKLWELKHEVKELSQTVTIDQSVHNLIEVTFQIIDARTLILENKDEEAGKLLKEIKEKGALHLATPAIETVFNSHFSERAKKQEQKKIKARRVASEDENEIEQAPKPKRQPKSRASENKSVSSPVTPMPAATPIKTEAAQPAKLKKTVSFQIQETIDSSPPQIPATTYEQLSEVLGTEKTDITSNENIPLLPVSSEHSINEDPPRRKAHDKFWIYFGVVLLLTGLVMASTGVGLVILAPTITAMVGGCILLSLGAVAAGSGMSIICSPKYGKVKKTHAHTPTATSLVYENKQLHKQTEQHFDHPVNLYAKNGVAVKTKAHEKTAIETFNISEQKINSPA